MTIRRFSSTFALPLLALCVGAACEPREEPGTQVNMRFAAALGQDGPRNVWQAPVPSSHLLRDDGSVETRGFPNPDNVQFIQQALELIGRDSRGFSPAAPLFVTLTGALDAQALPGFSASVALDSPVLLMNVDAASAELGALMPIRAEFLADGGPFGAPNMLAVLPLQGRPLRPGTRYALVVRRALRDSAGAPLGVSLQMSQLRAGRQPAGLTERAFSEYRQALTTLSARGVAVDDIAGLAVFTTDDPTRVLREVRDHAQENHALSINAPARKAQDFPTYCVYETTVDVPVYQQGAAPYFNAGGAWTFADDGAPAVQARETANLIITVPKRAAPPGGFPSLVYVRQGGGGKWPLIERGVIRGSVEENDPLGTGPAREFARAGFMAMSLDGPHGGLRNVTGTDEQLTLYNFFNPVALRDNMRQSGLELSLLAQLTDTLSVDASDCAVPGGGAVGQARVSQSQRGIMGHSTGAWITPLAVAFEPRFDFVLLSGAGASWVENITYKKSPIDVPSFAEQMLGFSALGRTITEVDPATMLAQWAADPSDPQHYARHIAAEPPASARHTLIFQGIVDTYIFPPIANAMSLAIGVDMALPMGAGALDAAEPRLQAFTPLEPLLPLVARQRAPFPVTRNVQRDRPVTAALVQYPQDPFQDGHEIVFQRSEPKFQYACFLKTYAETGAPRLIAGADNDAGSGLPLDCGGD